MVWSFVFDFKFKKKGIQFMRFLRFIKIFDKLEVFKQVVFYVCKNIHNGHESMMKNNYSFLGFGSLLKKYI